MTQTAIIIISLVAGAHAAAAILAIHQYRNRWKIQAKDLMERIVFCSDYSQLCALELEVDKFFDQVYPKHPESVTAMAARLYEAINQRTEEFTGYQCAPSVLLA